MHPEIMRDHPGGCPIRGMALELAVPLAGEVPNPELIDFTRRLIVAAVLCLPLQQLSMVGPMRDGGVT